MDHHPQHSHRAAPASAGHLRFMEGKKPLVSVTAVCHNELMPSVRTSHNVFFTFNTIKRYNGVRHAELVCLFLKQF